MQIFYLLYKNHLLFSSFYDILYNKESNLKSQPDFVLTDTYYKLKGDFSMKLILAILHSEDGNKVLTTLNDAGFSVTKLATTGGFLRAGNITLIVGTEEERVEEAISIFKERCRTRKHIMTTPISAGMAGMYTPQPIEVEVGGATIFVLDVDRFEKV